MVASSRAMTPAAGIVLEEFKTIPGNNYYTKTIQKYSEMTKVWSVR